MVDLTPIPQAEINEEDRVKLSETFGTGESFINNAAEYIMDFGIGNELKDLVPPQGEEITFEPSNEPINFTLRSFLDGTHSFHLIPGYEQYRGRKFSPLEVVETFSNLRSGEDIPGTEKGMAFLRGAIPAGAGLVGTVKGASVGARAGFAMGGPKGALVLGAIGAIGGGLGLQTAAESILETDALFGPETNYIPGTDETYRALKSAGLMAPYALIPWAIKPDVSLGAAKAIEAHFRRLGKGRLGPTVYAAGRRRNPETGMLEGIQPPRGLRLAQLAENALGSTAARARGTAFERAHTAGIEASAVVGGAGAVYLGEPVSDLGQLGYEFAGALGTPIAAQSTLRPFALLFEGIKQGRRAYKEAGKEGLGPAEKFGAMGKSILSAYRNRKQGQAAEVIRGFLEKEGEYSDEDILELARRLEQVSPFEEVGGVKLNLTSAQKTGDPLLLAIEASLASSLGGLSQKQAKERDKANTAVIGLLGALLEQGDPATTKVAGEFLYGMFEDGMANRTARNWEKWHAAWEKFSGGKDMNMTTLGTKLYEIIETDLKAARAQEKQLWEAIDDVPITKFYNVKRTTNQDTGEVEETVEATDIPGVVRYFDQKVQGRALEALSEENRQKLGTLTRSIEEIRTQMGLAPGPAPVVADLPEQTKLLALRNKLAGEDSLTSVDDILSGRKELSRPGPAVDPGPPGIERTSQTGPAEERFKQIKEGVLSAYNVSERSGARAFDDAEKAMGIEKDIEAGNLKAAIDKLDDFFLPDKRDKIEQFTDVPVFGTFAEDSFMELVKARTALLRTFKEQGPARPSFTKLTLQRDDNGQLEVTQENVDTLGQIISQREKNKPRGSATTSHKQSQDVLRAEKNLLSARLGQAATAPAQVSAAPDPVRLQQLIALRSRALAYAREFGAVQGHSGFAKMASDIASIAKRDIENFIEFGDPGEQASNVVQAYTAANSYSRALNDTFTRGFVDDATARTRRGDLEIAPENVIAKLKQSADVSAQRYTQLIQVDEFMRQNNLTVAEGPDGNFTDLQLAKGMENTVDNILRAMVARTREQTPDGQLVLNPKKLQDFVRDMSGEGRPLDYFPKLQEDLSDLNIAQQLFDATEKGIRTGTKAFENQFLYSQLRGIDPKQESVAGLVQSAMSSATPVRKFEFLMKPLTNKNIPEELRERAKKGFLSAVLEHTVGVEAGAMGAKFNAKTAYQKLFLPLKRGEEIAGKGTIPRGAEAAAQRRSDIRASRNSLMDLLVKNGVISEVESTRLERLTRELVRFQSLEQTGELAGALTEGVGPMMDFYLRIAGSALGTAAQRAMPLGASGPGALVAAGAGSKLVRKIFDEMPQIATLGVMQEMMENPALLAAMLKKPKSERAANNLTGAIKTYLAKAGIITPARRLLAPLEVEDDDEVVVETDDDLAGGAGDDQLTQAPQMPPAPQFQLPSQQAGFLPQLTQAAQAGAPASRPTGQPNPQQRQGLASLFPDDPILGVGRAV